MPALHLLKRLYLDCFSSDLDKTFDRNSGMMEVEGGCFLFGRLPYGNTLNYSCTKLGNPAFVCKFVERIEDCTLRLRANGRNIVDQQLPALLDVTCCVRWLTLLHVVACCCAKFETGQTFQPLTPNISFVL